MDKRIERWVLQAEHILKEGHVLSIDFSGPTYQAEVYDPQEGESFWPFLQFDERNQLKDAFCSCEQEEGCPHLTAAYLTIFPPDKEPIHVRFESSFWNHLCRLIADHSGYDERFLEKLASGHYQFQNEVFFEMRSHTPTAATKLDQMVEMRMRETPENSLKFSNIAQEEIIRWREGRPGKELRYILSFWPELAKWMMALSDATFLNFQEDAEGYPTLLTIQSPEWIVNIVLKKDDLCELIPFLQGIESSLKLIQLADEKIQNISFDPSSKTFKVSHIPFLMGEKLEKRNLKRWVYVPGIGFYPQRGGSLLSKERIDAQEASYFLDLHHDLIRQFIPIQMRPTPVQYKMYFDQQWSWHFEIFLFKPGDLIEPESAFLGQWAYLKGKGFYALKDALFNVEREIISPTQVSDFVNHHRIWLNGQPGFQTHLASVESQLTYSMDNDALRFLAKENGEAMGGIDFGDWIYYQGLGFFSKKHARIGLVARPGLEVAEERIGAFIRANREELELIPRFFTTQFPLVTRGLEIKIPKSREILSSHQFHGNHTSLMIQPIYTLTPPFKEEHIRFFGDFIYLVGEGFCELPLEMRIPEAYSQPILISEHELSHFLEMEFPHLKKYLLNLDVFLMTPLVHRLSVHYLARTSGGGLKIQLMYQSEYGQVSVTQLLESTEHKRRYCLTPAGLIDLHSEPFQWVKTLKSPYQVETQMIELSTMEFIRLDASFGLSTPTEESPTAQVTCNLIKELREFTSHENPNLNGLKSELRFYQQTGLHWLWFLYKNGLSGLLCDEMGLGKTHQAMALIAASMNAHSSEPKHYLVVCPTSVIYHWQDKLEIFLPHLTVQTFHGFKRTLKSNLKGHLILTSYGILRVEQQLFETIPFDIAIYDEVQVAKNSHSRLHGALKKIKARTRIGLTGTPIENNLRELKALFDVVLPSYMPSENRFRDLFINPIEKEGNEERKALLSQMVRPFILRRRKSEVLQELPEKSEDKSYCELSPEQIKMYQETLAQNRDGLINELRDQNTPINYIHIFSLLSRLKQICDHPALVLKTPAQYKQHTSGKWDLFVELLGEARESHQKVVVFSQFLYMLDIIENYLKEKKWGYAQIRGDTVNRREELKRFQEDPSCVVFIGSLQAAGLGIDLTAASVVFLYDRWWNAARENQAIDRVHRIGQKWGVQVYKLITKKTIEERIDQMIMRKGKLLEEVILSDDQTLLKNFTRSELIELLNFHESI